MKSIFSHVLLILLSACLLRGHITRAQSNSSLSYCYPDYGNYTQGSQYESNLKSLLNSLASNTHLNDFYNTSSGNGTDKVYGLIQCRGDISEEDCRNCQTDSAKQLVQLCPKSRKAHVSYDNCWLYYDDNLTMIINSVGYFDVANVSKSESFTKEVQTLMTNLSHTAASNHSKLAKGISTSSSVYGLVQCARDFSEESCLDCSLGKINYISGLTNDGSQYYRALSPICFVRYDIHSFFQSSAPSPANPPLPYSPVPANPPVPYSPVAPPPETGSNGAEKMNSLKNMVIAMGISVVLIELFY